jgi:hypothetical protein
MTTRVRSHIFPLGCAALLSLLACKAGESTSPAPEATASATPATQAPPTTPPDCCKAPYGRWAIVVVYSEKSGKCDKVAGPPRVGARHNEKVIWRVYNRCGKQQTVRIDGFTLLEKDLGVPPADDDNYRMQQDRSAAPGKTADASYDPFEPGDRSVTVKAGGAADLTLKVKADAKYGVYQYVTYLSDKPDADQQIEIWP